jgi:hypothetical protein
MFEFESTPISISHEEFNRMIIKEEFETIQSILTDVRDKHNYLPDFANKFNKLLQKESVYEYTKQESKFVLGILYQYACRFRIYCYKSVDILLKKLSE